MGSFYQTIGTPSPHQTYTVSGTDLTSDITITPPFNYEVSANSGATWNNNANPLVLTRSGQTVSNTTVWVRLNATSPGAYNGNIVHTSSGAATVNLAVSGTAVNAPAITSYTLQQWPLIANASDDPAVRSSSVTASTPTFSKLYLSNGTQVPAIPAYSSTYGQAFGSGTSGEGTWFGGSLNRTYFEQFTVTATSSSVRIDSLLFQHAFYNTANGRMGIVYSLSGFTNADSTTNVISGIDPGGASIVGSFANPIISANQTGGPTNLYRMNLGGANGVTIPADGTLTIRMYFAAGTTSAGRYALLRNALVKGEVLTALPLNLITFNAGYDNNKVNIWWSTLNEINADSYVIERSSDGRRFTSLGSVAAQNAASHSNYTHTDGNPITGVVYYRLKMIDKDGTVKYSRVVVVNSRLIGKVVVFPNPATSVITITHRTAGANATIEIVSLDGRRIITQKLVAGATQTSVDVSSLPTGKYNVVMNGGQKASSGFLKQ